MRIALGIAAILGLLGLVGQSDFEAEQADQARYCDMVKADLWPDYQRRSQCR